MTATLTLNYCIYQMVGPAALISGCWLLRELYTNTNLRRRLQPATVRGPGWLGYTHDGPLSAPQAVFCSTVDCPVYAPPISEQPLGEQEPVEEQPAKGPSDHEVAAWYPRLFRTALRMTGNVEHAWDLTQEALYRALKNWDRFKGQARRTTWLHKILVNCVRDWSRRQKTASRIKQLSDWELVPAQGEHHCPAQKLVQQKEIEQMRQAIEELPERIRSAFVATMIHGYTYSETAELLDLSMGTVASRVHRARKILNSSMQKTSVKNAADPALSLRPSAQQQS
jgi:RNA polymerase sigma-70 factor (ECF subfamily)